MNIYTKRTMAGIGIMLFASGAITLCGVWGVTSGDAAGWVAISLGLLLGVLYTAGLIFEVSQEIALARIKEIDRNIAQLEAIRRELQ